MRSLILFCFVVAVGFCCQIKEPTRDWWQNAQFYQIYPRSFKDSNGDGIGDLNGITEKLQHLKDIGITATWLSPIYKSPMADFGYDISDFTDIQDEYGTMADFEKLIAEANRLGIKVIMDFVPNHSSDEHVWFEKSVNREDGYDDFYVWHDGYVNENDPSKRDPPSNWRQTFRGSAWEWNDKRKQFYLHQFAVKQPDLNYRNPKVVETMKNVLRFWLGKGVAGFRVDAVPWLFEISPDENGRYKDEPLSGYTNDPEEAAYLKHIYTQDQPETVDMALQWRKVLDDFKAEHGGDTRILMIETYSELDEVMKFYGTSTRKGAQIPFNFNFITKANKDSTAKQLDVLIDLWFSKMPKGQTPNWVMGNHDQRRVGSRYGKERIDTMNMIVMMLPGASITYNGEEIGMLDVDISYADSKDPAACNAGPELYEKFTRDPARTPFQWDNTKNAGFSTGDTTWLPVSDNFAEINVKSETEAIKSHLKIYKSLVELRQTKTLKFGTLKHKAFNDDVLVIEREWSKEPSYVMVANIGPNKQIVNLSEYTALPTNLIFKIVSVSSIHKPGDKVAKAAVTLYPYESVILASK